MSGLITTRYPNSKDTPTHQRQHCPWCCDQGLVQVGTERSSSNFKDRPTEGVVEMWGPCPNCEVGLALENELYPRGFWQGRTIDLQKTCSCNAERPSRDEVRAMLAQANQYMQQGNSDPEPDAPRIRHNPGQRLSPGGGGGGTRPALPPPRADRPPPKPQPQPEPEPKDHRCSAHDGKNMPWPESTCQSCHPAEEITL